jgi:hypothetical protein
MAKRAPVLTLILGALTLLLVSCGPTGVRVAFDVSLLQGAWEGIFEYLDYQSDAERVRLPAALTITLPSADGAAGPSEATFVFVIRGPDGTSRTEEMGLRYFPAESLVEFGGNWAVTEATADAGLAYLLLVFAGRAEDDDRDALVRQTIERAGDALTLRREVRYDGADEFIVRSEYRLVHAEP